MRNYFLEVGPSMNNIVVMAAMWRATPILWAALDILCKDTNKAVEASSATVKHSEACLTLACVVVLVHGGSAGIQAMSSSSIVSCCTTSITICKGHASVHVAWCTKSAIHLTLSV